MLPDSEGYFFFTREDILFGLFILFFEALLIFQLGPEVERSFKAIGCTRVALGHIIASMDLLIFLITPD